MKIKFVGASGGDVTGSKHIISVNGKKILLDCGMFQGKRAEAEDKNKNFLFDPKEIDVMILSHAHIDHSGSIPYLVKQGFSGPIYCTHATRDLCNYMLLDSAFIQENEIKWLKKNKKIKANEEVEPYYSSDDAEMALALFHGVGYEKSFIVSDGVVASFYDAGHILGSSLVHLLIYDKETKKRHSLCFTGDLGRRGLALLRDPQPIPPADYLITETTYGNRLHANITTVEEDLAVVVNQVIAQKGSLIIPSFALERAQEIIYYLNLLISKKLIPSIPVFIDSPLAGNVTEVFRSHPECFDKETFKNFLSGGKSPFDGAEIHYTRSVDESKEINEKEGPMIIISASGMCEHGRILHHLKNNISDPKNIVLIVGYQAENTLGRKLVMGDKVVSIFGDSYDVKASIYIMDAFSAHADRSDLLEYISRIEGLKKIFLVHGESTQRESFRVALSQNGFKDIYLPSLGEEIDL